MTWPAVDSISVDTIEIEWQRDGDDIWQQISVTGDSTQTYISPVEDGGEYTVRARTVCTAYNARSVWTYEQHTVNANSATPANALQFSAKGGLFCIYLSWIYPVGADIAKLEIYGSSQTISPRLRTLSILPIHRQPGRMQGLRLARRFITGRGWSTLLESRENTFQSLAG